MTPDGILTRESLAQSEEALEQLPLAPAVFAIHPEGGRPYLARTSMLRRRALRLLKRRELVSRLLNLRESFARLEFWLTGSTLDAAMKLYDCAKLFFPDEYAKVIRLRLPSYVKLLAGGEWPRTMITTHLGGTGSVLYGPFRNRLAAEAFEHEFLDLFQIRRCQEDLAPSPEHPGCIYGEMNKCLRPCQEAVGHEEYGREVSRASEFLMSNGQSLVKSITAARDALSQDMEFEEAARQHKRLEKVEEVLKLRDDFAGNLERLNAVALARSARPSCVDLFFLRSGHWQGMMTIDFDLVDGKPVSLDRKLREALASAPQRKLPSRERGERLAILAKWAYSTWRDGELIIMSDLDDAPVRKLVNAISRVMAIPLAQ